MDGTQPGLFDLPDREPVASPKRQAGRGSNRQTWARTATAVVTVIDAAAVHQAAAQVQEFAIPIGVGGGQDPENPEPALPEPRPADDAFDALSRLIWPTDGLEELLEAGVLRIVSIVSEVAPETAERGTVTWTVTVKLTDAEELRRLATKAHPEQAAQIAERLEVAWQCTADPFAPLRSIPGIAWQPGQVHVEHQRARANR